MMRDFEIQTLRNRIAQLAAEGRKTKDVRVLGNLVGLVRGDAILRPDARPKRRIVSIACCHMRRPSSMKAPEGQARAHQEQLERGANAHRRVDAGRDVRKRTSQTFRLWPHADGPMRSSAIAGTK
jgi:hypothetical protein